MIGEGEQVSQIARILKMRTETEFSRLCLESKHVAHMLKRRRRLR